MSILATAIARKNWELAALCLILGLIEAVSRIPEDSVIGLFDVINGGQNGEKES